MRLRSFVLLVAPFVVIACGAPDEPLGTAVDPITVCPTGTTLEGIDVSHWQGTIDWAKVKGAGKSFAIFKATEGLTFVDSQFSANWAGTKQNGVVRGAYHFFHSDTDPIAQADHFLATMGALEPGDLPPTLDLEVTDGQSGATITANAIQWLDHVAAATGTKPILYTGPSFVNSTLHNPAGLDAHAQLWIAHWGVNCPNVPAPFTGWPFWQYDDKGTVSGISGSSVDLDKFNGTLDDLMAITVQPPSSSSSSSSGGGSGGAGGAGTGGAGGATTTTSAAGGAGGAGETTTPSDTGTGTGTGGGGGSGDSGGCSCSLASESSSTSAAGWLAALGLAVAARRRRR